MNLTRSGNLLFVIFVGILFAPLYCTVPAGAFTGEPAGSSPNLSLALSSGCYRLRLDQRLIRFYFVSHVFSSGHDQKEEEEEEEEACQILEIPQCPVVEINEPVSTASISNSLLAWQQSVRRSSFITRRQQFLQNLLVSGSVQLLTQERGATLMSTNSQEAGMDNSQRDICLAKPEILAKLDESFLSLLGLSYQKLKQPGVNYISYRVRARRIDTIVQDTQGDLKLVTGEPSYLAPEPPVLKTQDRAVANVYASECCAPIAAADIMPVEKKGEEPAEVFEHNQQALKHSLSKLAANQGLKIVFWGDSVTVGGFASSGEHFFTNQFLSLLHKAYPCNQIAYLNLGVSGANSAQLLPSFAKDVLEKKPDLVVVEFVNDYLLPVETLSKSYKSMITRSSVAGVDLILCVPHVVLPGYLKLNTWDEVNNSALPRLLRYLGKTETVAIADVARRFQLMKSVGLRPELMLIDGELHPGNLGHQLYAEEILACFVRHKKG